MPLKPETPKVSKSTTLPTAGPETSAGRLTSVLPQSGFRRPSPLGRRQHPRHFLPSLCAGLPHEGPPHTHTSGGEPLSLAHRPAQAQPFLQPCLPTAAPQAPASAKLTRGAPATEEPAQPRARPAWAALPPSCPTSLLLLTFQAIHSQLRKTRPENAEAERTMQVARVNCTGERKREPRAPRRPSPSQGPPRLRKHGGGGAAEPLCSWASAESSPPRLRNTQLHLKGCSHPVAGRLSGGTCASPEPRGGGWGSV